MNAKTAAPSLPLPEDVLLEQAILGGCIAYAREIDGILQECRDDDFYHFPHGMIFAAIAELHAANIPVSPLSLNAKLGASEAVHELGGHAYFANMALAAPAGGYSSLARQLADLARRREAMIACMGGAEALSARTLSISEALRPILDAADAAMRASSRTETTADAIQSALRRAEEAANGQKTTVSVPTGLRCLDKALGGLQAGDFCIYAGRPGMGKSSLLLATGLAAAFAGRPTIVFSLEMTREQLLHRAGTDIDYDTHHNHPMSYSWFRSGDVRPEQVGRLALALRQLPPHFEIYDGADFTIHDIAAISKGFAARYGQMGVVVIDYLQKVAATDRYRGSKVQEITEISGAAKSLAKRLGWPVLAGAQLNRGVEGREDRRPTLSDLRESGAIEQDADQVIGLYRPGYYIAKRKPASVHDPKYQDWETEWLAVANRLELLMLKNRHGAEDVFEVFCDMRASAIRDEKPEGRFVA